LIKETAALTGSTKTVYNHGMWQLVSVIYWWREKRFLSLLSLTKRYNEIWGAHVLWLHEEWFKSVCYLLIPL